MNRLYYYRILVIQILIYILVEFGQLALVID